MWINFLYVNIKEAVNHRNLNNEGETIVNQVKKNLQWGKKKHQNDFIPADVASTSQVTSARSGFSPLARSPPYIPAALNPFAAVTPPGTYTQSIYICVF